VVSNIQSNKPLSNIAASNHFSAVAEN